MAWLLAPPLDAALDRLADARRPGHTAAVDMPEILGHGHLVEDHQRATVPHPLARHSSAPGPAAVADNMLENPHEAGFPGLRQKAPSSNSEKLRLALAWFSAAGQSQPGRVLSTPRTPITEVVPGLAGLDQIPAIRRVRAHSPGSYASLSITRHGRPAARPRRRNPRRDRAVREHLPALLPAPPRGHHRRPGRADRLTRACRGTADQP